MNVLQEFGIQNNIFSITFDNATNNTAAIELFNRQLKTPVGNDLYHVRCVCHIINLIVKDGLETFEDKIKKIKDVILYIRSSSYRYQDFKKFCKAHGSKCRRFSLDTVHRWNTTYLMLQSTNQFKNIISLYVQQNQLNMIFPDDWEVCRSICNFLEVFYIATKECSGVYYPTIQLIISHIYNIAQIFQEYRDNPIFTNACVVMEIKILKYWQDLPILFALASVMDPRLQLKGVQYFIDTINELLKSNLIITGNDVKLAVTNLYNLYEMKYSTSTASTNTATPSTSTSGVRGKKPWNAIANYSRQSTSVSSRNELFKYLDTDFSVFLTESEKDNLDILAWWRDHTRNFSILSIMARDLLTPPASTVASEAAFSAGNRQMEERRSSLSPEILECQICIKDWDDAKYRIQHEVTEENYILEPFNNMDLADDDEATEDNN